MIMGIDPGLSGAVALLRPDGSVFYLTPYSKTTPHDLVSVLLEPGITKAYIEAVHSMPKQGVSSTFKFGENYGLWQGILTALKIPFERVYPLKWQTVLGCRTSGDKNISKRRAQELFPDIKVTHAIADALLIAEYGRRRELLLDSSDL